jgi:hypothetical protein
MTPSARHAWMRVRIWIARAAVALALLGVAMVAAKVLGLR